MSELSKKSLTEIVKLIKKKEIKSEEITQSFIKNIETTFENWKPREQYTLEVV